MEAIVAVLVLLAIFLSPVFGVDTTRSSGPAERR